MRPEEVCRLRQNANEVQGKEVGLVYYLLVPKQFILVIIWTFDASAHVVDHGTGQVAGRGQLQSTCLGCSSKQKERIRRDRRFRDFCRSQVGFEADGRITGRG